MDPSQPLEIMKINLTDKRHHIFILISIDLTGSSKLQAIDDTLYFPSLNSLQVRNISSSLDKEMNYSDKVIEINSLLQKDLEPSN